MNLEAELEKKLALDKETDRTINWLLKSQPGQGPTIPFEDQQPEAKYLPDMLTKVYKLFSIFSTSNDEELRAMIKDEIDFSLRESITVSYQL